MARPGAGAVATNAGRAEAGYAIHCGQASRTIGRLRACARSIARETTFVVGIASIRNRSTRAIVSLAFFRRSAGHAGSVADIAAANSIDAIVRQTVRGIRARNPVVLFAGARTGTRSGRTFIVGIRIVFDVSARSARSAAFLRCRTCLAPS